MLFRSKADVQAWLENPSTNFGWLIKDEIESSATTARRFGSREDAVNSPRLRIEYEIAHVVRISSAAIVNGQFCLRFTAQAGKSYIVERRERMGEGSWNIISTLPPATTTQEATMCDPLGVGNAFYHIGEL